MKSSKNLLVYFFILFALINFKSYGQIKADKTEGCTPLVVDFEIENITFESILWETEDGQKSSVENPTFIFEQIGEWEVTAIATLKSGEQKTFQYKNPISVYQKPEVDFSIDTQSSCVGQEINFINLTDNADSYIWSFGDGNQSNEANPAHQYEEAGLYTVTLSAQIEGACQEIKVLEDAIEIKDVGDFEVTVSRFTQCLSDSKPIEFRLEGSYNQIEWDFGDGNYGSGPIVEHTYDAVGDYQVQLNFLSENGCRFNTQLDSPISVQDIEIPTIERNKTSVCLGSEVKLKAVHPAKSGFSWIINDEHYTGKEINVVLNQLGDTDVKLTYTNELGCSVSVIELAFLNIQEINSVDIDYSEFSGCAPFNFIAINITEGAVAYSWKVNGKIIKGSELDYTFEKEGKYKIIALTEYANGCTLETELEKEVEVFKKETDVKVSDWEACAPYRIDFELLNEKVSNAVWNINGNDLTGNKVNFEFKEPGIYFPSVTYINEHGCQVIYDFESPITVYDRSIPLDEPDVIESCTYTQVYFSGDMGYDSWHWEFGDGSTSNEQNPVHSYSEPGSYEVSLTTNNKNGCETTIEKYNIITIPDLEVATDLEVSKGGECGFFNVAIYANLTEGQNANWFYNDNLIGTDKDLKVSFISLGDVGITLVVASEGNCSKTKSIMVPNPWSDCENPEIEEEIEETDGDSPIGKFKFSSCNLPYSIDLSNPVPSARKIQWRYSDGQKHSRQNFTETFTTSGEHTIGFWAIIDSDSTLWVEDYITVTIQESDIDFDYELKKVCEGFELLLNPENPDFQEYRWKLNNREIELSEEGSIFVEKEGLYSVSLTASNQSNCASTKIKNIFIGNQENQFTYSKSICLNDGLVIDHKLVGFQSIKWDMGNGDIIAGFNSPYQYSDRGEYAIQAIATDFEGCEHIFDLPKKVKVLNPIADFRANKTLGCGETTIRFRNLSEEAESWFWDFGNGATSTDKDPTVKFLPGTYTITLRAMNGDCMGEITKTDLIEIEELSSDFSFNYNQTCLPLEVNFTDESVNAVSWLWDFGDGNTSTLQNPTHTYLEVPKSQVKLTVENERGCKVTSKKAMDFIFSASFQAKETEICLGQDVNFKAISKNAQSWLWDFGDGNTSTLQNPIHSYQSEGIYDVQLIAESGDGCHDTVSIEKFIKVIPAKADFQLSETISSNCVPVQVGFTDLSKGAVRYFWDFGDGKTSKVANPIHTYNKVGEFDVTLVITNELGCQDTMRKEAMVKVSGPETEFEIEEKIVCLPNTANFKDISQSAVDWRWIFGDGNTSTERNPNHLYEEPGIYEVTLIAKNEQGCEQIFKMDSIKVLPTPKVDFEMEVSGECYPVEVNFQNKSTNLLSPSYFWDFGDGQISKMESPTISFTKPGKYEVSLTVMNDDGCPVSFTHASQILIRDTVKHTEAKLNQILVENNIVQFEIEPYYYNNISHYNVYRDSPNGFNLLQRIDINGQPNQRIMYDDKSCRPQDMSHEYIFQAVPLCEDTVSKAQLTVFNTLLLQPNAEINEKNERALVWNSSKGFKIDNQRIFRKAKGDLEWQEIAVIEVNAISFQDEEDLCPGFYEYRIGAFEQNTLRSISNYIEFEVSDKIYKNQIAEIKNTTVLESGEVFTEWTIPDDGKGRISSFEIFRSENGSEFKYHDTVDPHEQFYIDNESNTEENTYSYQVKVINDCAVDTESSGQSTTILLEKNVQFRKYELQWNAYKGWDKGVKKYIIQRLNENGEWETVEEVSADKRNIIIKDTQD